MSGIRFGSRLDQLRALRAQLDQEIANEEYRDITGNPGRPTPPRAPRLVEVNRVDLRLRQLGVSSREVKVWAVAAGLIPEVKRGRVAEALVEQFAEARAAMNDQVRSEA